jgi:hypothetical protein
MPYWARHKDAVAHTQTDLASGAPQGEMTGPEQEVLDAWGGAKVLG